MLRTLLLPCSVLLVLLAGCQSSLSVTDVHGAQHEPLELGHDHAVVVIFLTVDCPIANSFAPEIKRILDDYLDSPVRFYLVHVDPDVTMERAREHAEQFGLEATILLDHNHSLVEKLGATMTPEAAVLAKNGLVYRGRINNWYADLGAKRPAPTRHDLRDAITAVLTGTPIEVPRTEAIGCFLGDLR